jgi:hypothetical protein
MILFTTEHQGDSYGARADSGAPFPVGRSVHYKQNIGLYNDFAHPAPGLLYAAQDFAAAHGFWAAFIEPTAYCEGRSFLTLNTYDRAAFTFGFSQFAAHVPDGDFVSYLRALLKLPEAARYFADLELQGGRIVHVDAQGSVTPLESSASTAPLMAYLNPSLAHVDDAEVLAAARLIHWTTHYASAREAQVIETVRMFGIYMAGADRRKLIDGRAARLCCVIADILHQGRGGWNQIATALANGQPYAALLAIGGPEWAGRRATLDQHISADPHFATMHWSSQHQDFVPQPAAAPVG